MSRWAAALLWCVLATAHALSAEEPEGEWFDAQIAPLLVDRCLECHSGSDPKGGLDLTTPELAARGGESGTVLVPSDLDESLLWQRVDSDEMPPDHPLDPQDKQLLRAWIEAGARWGQHPIDRLRITTSHRAGFDWWSLAPVARPALPALKDVEWPLNGVDYFVLQRLEAAQLSPSAPADRRVLIRRLYFDLLGLPPTVEDVLSFERDPSPNAYERLVERVLASPHYGERWARHWLDIVRFGESDGFERNMPRQSAWPYRDWVIAALNSDMPYDRFVRQQIAGDALPDGDGESIRATGFLVAGLHNTVVANNDTAKRVARHEELEDMIGTLSQALLGLTVQCARCHDHKFDPIAQSDYYQLVAALDGVQHGERVAESDEHRQQREADLKSAQEQLATLKARIRGLDYLVRARILAERGDQLLSAHLPVVPISRWSFEEDARDSLGALHGELQGGAIIADGKLKLNGVDAFVVTRPLAADLREKTLESWVVLDNLDQQGGAALSIETTDGAIFDAIVYGERQPRRWMAGSNSFQRTRDLTAVDETLPGQLVHVVITYHTDGMISVFRDGAQYGDAYRPDAESPPKFAAGASRILLGKRHTGGGRPWLAGAIDEARLYNRALEPSEVRASFDAGPNVALVSTEELLAAMSDAEKSQREDGSRQVEHLEARISQLAALPKVYAVVPGQPPETRILMRGDVSLPGETVLAASPRVFDERVAFDLEADAPEALRRRELAVWITHRHNPLFARVMVNRVWHYHFGRGIVETPSDFGFNGGRPSHPELLDWLAADFIDSGFQLKTLHRLLVTSRTYRQAARQNEVAMRVDADNRLLWRKSPHRLEGESLRDAMLAVAGQLNSAMGGPGYRDVREYFNSGTTYYEPLDVHGSEFFRRTIYRFSPRGERSPLLDTFDCPDPSVATPRRQITTTPLQALALLNDAFTLRIAGHLADRVRVEVIRASEPSLEAHVEHAFLLTLQRKPTPTQLESSVHLAAQFGLPQLCRALLNTHEFVIVE